MAILVPWQAHSHRIAEDLGGVDLGGVAMRLSCPKCKNSVNAETGKLFCYLDGSRLLPNHRCDNCDKELSIHDKYCEYCGAQQASLQNCWESGGKP